MSEKMVGVPSVKGITGSFKDFGVGAIGGILFLISYRLFGALGVLVAPLIAGSMIKGDRGTIVATMAGFMLLAMGVLGMGGGGDASSDSGVM